MIPTQEEAFARIRLLRSPNVGPVSYYQLLSRFGSAAVAIEALPTLAGRGGAAYRPAAEARVAGEVSALRKAGVPAAFALPQEGVDVRHQGQRPVGGDDRDPVTPLGRGLRLGEADGLGAGGLACGSYSQRNSLAAARESTTA